MSGYTNTIERLIELFKKMPGIGPKSAERLMLYILRSSNQWAKELAQTILKVKESIRFCKICNNLSEAEVCQICSDAARDKSIICVVEQPQDVSIIEKTGSYKGLYHVLGGALSPLDAIGPGELKINELIKRINKGDIKEVIIATDSDTEGEITALYLVKLIKPLGVKITRIAYGIPMGTNLEYADQATLTKALEGRRDITS